MEIVYVEQGTPEWHAFRQLGIGGSDIPVIMGVSPYRTLEQLWLDKMGEGAEQVQNYAMARGKRLEPQILKMYEDKHGIELTPACAIMDGVPHARISYDGLNLPLKMAVEAKAPNIIDHQMAQAGIVPKKYMPQVQWGLMIGDLDYIDYVSFHSGEIAEVRCVHDREYQVQMIEAAHMFWHKVINRIPVSHPVADDLLVLMQSYADLKRHADMIDLELKAIKECIWKRVPLSVEAAGFRGKWITKKGAVDYDKVPELNGVNLEMYRKSPIEYFDLRAIRGGE